MVLNYEFRENGKQKRAPPGGVEPPIFRLTAERANHCATEADGEVAISTIKIALFLKFKVGDILLVLTRFTVNSSFLHQTGYLHH